MPTLRSKKCLLAITVLIVLASLAYRYNHGPWVGQFYQNPDFTGKPISHRYRWIVADWGQGKPFRDWGEGSFSARWNTCLILDEDKDVRFQLIANGYGRLYINHEILIDQWYPEPLTEDDQFIHLEKGVHALRVDYVSHENGAAIELWAHTPESFDTILKPRNLFAPKDRESAQSCNAF